MPSSVRLPEFQIVIIGAQDKSILLERFFAVAIKCERHVQYSDLFYLTVRTDSQDYLIEIMDPGLDHTGAREMAIRKADAAILVYSSNIVDSFHELVALVYEFKRRESAQIPILLVANENHHDDKSDEFPAAPTIDNAQGETLARQLGDDSCRFLPIDLSSPTSFDAKQILDDIIRSINLRIKNRQRQRPRFASIAKRNRHKFIISSKMCTLM